MESNNKSVVFINGSRITDVNSVSFTTVTRGKRNHNLWVSDLYVKYIKKYNKLLNQLNNTKRDRIKKKIRNRINKLKR